MCVYIDLENVQWVQHSNSGLSIWVFFLSFFFYKSQINSSVYNFLKKIKVKIFSFHVNWKSNVS